MCAGVPVPSKEGRAEVPGAEGPRGGEAGQVMPPPRVCSQGPPSSPGRGRLGAPGTPAVGLGRVVIAAVFSIQFRMRVHSPFASILINKGCEL